jgi:hypothetical protein
MVKNEPLETFGKWQTELYIPPPAKVRAHIVLFYGGFSPPQEKFRIKATVLKLHSLV